MAAQTATLSAALVVLSPILPNSAGHSRVVPTSARQPASDTIRVEVVERSIEYQILRKGPN